MNGLPQGDYQLIVFDWDGTLMDSVAYICYCLQKAAEQIGLPVAPEKNIRDMIGLSMSLALTQLYPDDDEAMLTRLLDTYRQLFFTNNRPIALFPKTRETLQQLRERGYLLAVATGKSRRGLNEDLNHVNLKEMFISTRCADETASKPSPLMLKEILQEVGVKPAQALVVGDTEYDILMAKAAHVPSIGVSYGVHEPQRLIDAGASTYILQLSDLLTLLERSKE